MGTTSVVELDELPEPIIQHILSFLTAKEAARTALLSNTWRKAWLTRPDLTFEPDYPDNGEPIWDPVTRRSRNPVWELATKTIQRYEESNLKIRSLTLRVKFVDFYKGDIVRSNEFISKSLFLGATHLHLINLDLMFVLPHDIVFGSETLVELSVKRCEIYFGEQKVIRCSGLESLSLDFTQISIDTLSNIISSFPSIRKLSLSSVWVVDEEGNEIRSFGLGPINLHSLTRLELVNVEFDTLFLGDMSSRFPSLKDLTLHTYSPFSLSSRSLERLNFKVHRDKKRVKFEFDVPNIRRFTYQGSVIPLLSFKSTSRGWESHVSVKSDKKTDSFWFRRLNKFLTKLRRSKIHLSLVVSCQTSFDYEAGEIQGLRRRPRVENLTVDVNGLPTLSCYALFDGLFLLCRPKFITQYLHQGNAKNKYFLCKTLVKRVGNEQSHFMYHGLLDLEEVKLAIFDKAVGGVWRDVPLLESSLDAAPDDNERKKIRFQFKWKC